MQPSHEATIFVEVIVEDLPSGVFQIFEFLGF